MVDFTSHFRFGIPNFLQEPWHQDFETMVRQIDNVLYQMAIAESVSFWANSTLYGVSDLVLDEITGVMYTCALEHLSSAAPAIFSTERLNFPSRWSATANIPQQRGQWTTATSYTAGDFVVNVQRYAVCLVSHVSSADFFEDVSNGRWVILIDLSTVGVGINNTAEATLASGATVNIGAQAASRIFITGNTQITSFGIIANQIKILRYEQALTVKHHATDLILPAGADRITDAGGYQVVTSNSAGKWREVNWHPGAGPPAVPIATDTLQGVVELATAAETQALADGTRVVTPLGLGSALSDLSTSILNTIRNGVSVTLDTLSEIVTAMNLLAPAASPVFTGNPTGPTPATTDNDTSLATTAFVVAALGSSSVNPFQRFFHVRDQKASGTDGAGLAEDSWVDRELTTVITNNITSAVLAANVMSLPAGTYLAFGGATSTGGGPNRQLRTRHRLRNTTDGTTLLLSLNSGSSHLALDASHSTGAIVPGMFFGIFTLAGTKDVKLQSYIAVEGGVSTLVVCAGEAATSGEVEVYADLLLFKLV